MIPDNDFRRSRRPVPKNYSGGVNMRFRKYIFVWFTVLLMAVSLFSEAEMSDYVRLADHVTPDMLNADYWAGEEGDRLLLTREQIDALPENDSLRLLQRADELNADQLRNDILALGSKKPEECFQNGAPVTQEYLDTLLDNANVDGIPGALNIRYGYSVARASLRALPTNDFAGETENDLFYDKLVQSECMPFLPVLVVHESRDGEWYFVWFYGFGGWVEKEKIALCSSRGEWLARQQKGDFLLVTGRELRLNVDRGNEGLSGIVLPMGTRMPLLTVEETPESVSGRATFNSYAVKLPARDADGMIEDRVVLIPMSADVQIGYLDYTSRNVLTQAFKLLGDRYGWAGLDLSNDCSGIVREIWLCFGIEMDRTAGPQSRTSLAKIIDVENASTEEKMAALAALTPGSPVYFPGHIMIYLGTRDNIPYVISSVGSFAPEDMETGSVLSVNSMVVNSLLVRRKSGLTWLDSLTRLISIP